MVNSTKDDLISQLTDTVSCDFEVKDIRNSLVKNKQYTVARARLDEIEEDILNIQTQIDNSTGIPSAIVDTLAELSTVTQSLKNADLLIQTEILDLATALREELTTAISNLPSPQAPPTQNNNAYETVDDYVDFYWRSNGATSPDLRFGNKLNVAMNGFKYRGKYTKHIPTKILTDATTRAVTYESDLDAGVKVQDNWYGIFAVDNNNTLAYKLVTFARVHSVVGNKVFLAKHFNKTEKQNYNFSENVYANSDFIVASGSGLSTMGKITANGTDFITLDNVTGLAQGDWITISPAGFSGYSYLSSIFRDQAETMNFYKVKDWIYGYNSRDLFKQATTTDWTMIDVFASGLVPPTARMVRVFITTTYTGSSPFHYYLGSDGSSHILFDHMFKITNTPYDSVTADCPIEWNNGKLFYKSDVATNNVQIRVLGYSE